MTHTDRLANPYARLWTGEKWLTYGPEWIDKPGGGIDIVGEPGCGDPLALFGALQLMAGDVIDGVNSDKLWQQHFDRERKIDQGLINKGLRTRRPWDY